jgi:hypothetical protein
LKFGAWNLFRISDFGFRIFCRGGLADPIKFTGYNGNASVVMIWEAGTLRGLLLLLMLAFLAGCKGLFGTQGPPDDPLFLDKKPLEAKAQSSRPVAPNYSEPVPPINPYVVHDRSGLFGPARNFTAVSDTFEPDE